MYPFISISHFYPNLTGMSKTTSQVLWCLNSNLRLLFYIIYVLPSWTSAEFACSCWSTLKVRLQWGRMGWCCLGIWLCAKCRQCLQREVGTLVDLHLFGGFDVTDGLLEVQLDYLQVLDVGEILLLHDRQELTNVLFGSPHEDQSLSHELGRLNFELLEFFHGLSRLIPVDIDEESFNFIGNSLEIGGGDAFGDF